MPPHHQLFALTFSSLSSFSPLLLSLGTSVLVGLQRGKQPCLSSGSKLPCFSAFCCCSLASPFYMVFTFILIFLFLISASSWFCLFVWWLFFIFCDYFLPFCLVWWFWWSLSIYPFCFTFLVLLCIDWHIWKSRHVLGGFGFLCFDGFVLVFEEGFQEK